MVQNYPIPAEALDDRLAWVGTSGSGKTYNAGTAIERLLATSARAVICDPLGVWWGLRAKADGKTPAFPIVIFGGPHGDLPLTEHAGALVGEAAAGMAESCVVDLSDIGTAAGERRFMLGFLRALYQKASGQPLHLVLDEADMWAPQTIRDKDGDANKLFAITERIVRRGRIAGFIPWLITQRPAELSKSVLSQVDGLIAMTLTASQDRDALDAWIGGQADKAVGQAIKAAMPTLQQGQGVVWLPRRGVLETAQFPTKTTFDSSRTPKRGEVQQTVELKPLDLGKLKERLATVEAETKANDPRALKVEIAKLKADLAKATDIRNKHAEPDPVMLQRAETVAYQRGFEEGERLGRAAGNLVGQSVMLARAQNAVDGLRVDDAPSEVGPAQPAPRPVVAPARVLASAGGAQRTPIRTPEPVARVAGDGLSGPQRHLLRSLAWWAAMGHAAPTRTQLAGIAGWATRGSNLRARLSELSTRGLISYPNSGLVSLTDAGHEAAPEPDTAQTLLASVRGVLTTPQRALFEVLLESGRVLTRAELAEAVGWEAGGSNLRARLSEMSTLEIIGYPARGTVTLQEWVTG